MTHFSDTEILKIAKDLRDHSLPKSDWTHAAHFAAALALLADPKCNAEDEMPDLIRSYNLATGVENTDDAGYHHTITLASLRVARTFLNPGRTLADSLEALLASDYARSDWLLKYWSKDVLFSVEARRNWVAPDIQLMPFD